MILAIISSFTAGALSLTVACLSFALLFLKKRIVRRYGGYVVEPVNTEREEKAIKWISRLLWTAAILSTLIALLNITVGVLRIVGKSW